MFDGGARKSFATAVGRSVICFPKTGPRNMLYEFPLNMVHSAAALDARTTSETLEGAVICTGVNPNSY
jgi:hypothetical protein